MHVKLTTTTTPPSILTVAAITHPYDFLVTAILWGGGYHIINVSPLYGHTTSACPAGFMAVVMATAHPCTADGLIGWQTAIKVLLVTSRGDCEAGMQDWPTWHPEGTPVLSHLSSLQDVAFHLLLFTGENIIALQLPLQSQGCCGYIVCHDKGILKWTRFKA